MKIFLKVNKILLFFNRKYLLLVVFSKKIGTQIYLENFFNEGLMLPFTVHWARLSQLLSKGQRWLRSKEVFRFPAFVSLCCLVACTHSSVAEKAEFYYKKGQSLASHGNQKEAVENFELSLKLSEQIDFQAGVAHNLNELAILQTDQGDCAAAREFLARALNIYRQLDMKPEISKTLYNMALTYVRENNYDKALEQFNELLDWDRKTGNQLGEAITLYNTAIIYKNYLHQPDEAERLFSEALPMFEDLKRKGYFNGTSRPNEILTKYPMDQKSEEK